MTRMDFLAVQVFGMMVTLAMSQHNATHPPWKNRHLDNLDSFVMPPRMGSNVTDVEISLFINSFGTISEERMQISLEVMTREQWTDPRLMFDPHIDDEFVTRVELSDVFVTKIWRPNISFDNEKAGNMQNSGMIDQLAHVYYNGTVVHSRRMSLVLNCPMALYKYPHDSQKCSVILSSFAYTVDVVRFHWKKDEPIIFSPSIHLSRFTFNHTPEATRCQLNFTGIGEFTCLQTSIQLHREFGYYLLQIYLPSMMIVFVSWFSFYLPIDAVPARVSVGLITVLTLTTESSKARATLPHVSYITAIDLWMSVSMLFVFAAMLEYALVCIVHRRRNGRANFIPHPETTDTLPTIYNIHDPDVDKKTTSSIFARFNDKRIDVVCRFVFPVAYLTMQIAYWLYYMQH